MTVVQRLRPCCYQIYIKKIEYGAKKPAAMDSCVGFVRPRQHGTAGRRLHSHVINIKVMESNREFSFFLERN